MKKLVFALLVLALVSSCKETNLGNTQEDEFKNDLTALSNENFELFSVTKSGLPELNSYVMDQMIEKAVQLSEKYDLKQKIAESGYYSHLDDIPSEKVNESAMYCFVSINSTREFQKLLNDIAFNEHFIDNNLLINNPLLLPNEQISLLMLNNIVKNEKLKALITKHTLTDCRNTYNSAMSTCQNWMYVGVGLTVATAVATFGILSSVFGVATTVDYERCSGNAMNAYMVCSETAKKD